jgi:hypothetical protein
MHLREQSHVGDLDLDGLTLVAVVVLPAALDELAGHEDPHPFFKVCAAFSATDRHAVQRKNPSLMSCTERSLFRKQLPCTAGDSLRAPLGHDHGVFDPDTEPPRHIYRRLDRDDCTGNQLSLVPLDD